MAEERNTDADLKNDMKRAEEEFVRRHGFLPRPAAVRREQFRRKDRAFFDSADYVVTKRSNKEAAAAISNLRKITPSPSSSPSTSPRHSQTSSGRPRLQEKQIEVEEQ